MPELLHNQHTQKCTFENFEQQRVWSCFEGLVASHWLIGVCDSLRPSYFKRWLHSAFRRVSCIADFVEAAAECPGRAGRPCEVPTFCFALSAALTAAALLLLIVFEGCWASTVCTRCPGSDWLVIVLPRLSSSSSGSTCESPESTFVWTCRRLKKGFRKYLSKRKKKLSFLLRSQERENAADRRHFASRLLSRIVDLKTATRRARATLFKVVLSHFLEAWPSWRRLVCESICIENSQRD